MPVYANRTRYIKRSAIREMREAVRRPGMISFASGMPAEELFPIEELRRAAEATLRHRPAQALQYGSTEGDSALREAIAGRVNCRDATKVSAEHVLITTGSQQALDLIGRVFVDPGSTVVVERPTYAGALEAWNCCEPRYRTIALDDQGMRVDALGNELDGDVRFIYTIPTFQNPTGAVLSAGRRRALDALASERGIPLVEDDPYGDLRYDGEPLPTLLAIDGSTRADARPGNVLHLGSFSKVLAPGLRVGWVIGPAEMVARLAQAKQSMDLHTSSFTQLLALEALTSGFLDGHLVRLRTAYAARRNAMLTAIAAAFPDDVRWTRPEGGLYVWVTLPEEIDAADVLRDALAANVAFVPGATFFADGGGAHTLRLNFTHASPDQIGEGISRLGRILHRLPRRPAAAIACAPTAAVRRGTGADAIAESLAALGVRHVFGVGGANIEDLYLAVQKRRPGLAAILDKHEHSAGTAADAYARIRRSLGVVMTTSGGGAMNLVSALAESRASRVPVLAIVGEPPTTLQGRGAFQDTSGLGGSVDVQPVFRGVSVWCERARSASDLAALVETAARAALAGRGPAVLLVAKDLQQTQVDARIAETTDSIVLPGSAPDAAVIHEAARQLRGARVVIIAGDEVARTGAADDLGRVARALDAVVTVTPDGRDAFDNRDSRFAGVTGAMGHDTAARAIADATACLVVGTRLPLVARQGHEAALAAMPIVSLASELPFLVTRDTLHVTGDLPKSLRLLAAEFPDAGRPLTTTAPAARETWAPAAEFGSPAILEAIDQRLPEDAVVLVDAGNTGAHAVHYLRSPSRGRWLVAMGMAGMGYTFGAAIGAALASGRRTVVLAGDGAFFMHGLEIHTAVQHQLPITYVIFNNRAHGMCLVRERLLLGEEGGYNVFRDSRIGAGLATIFPGLHGSDCTTHAALERALDDALAAAGPSVICASLPDVEVPPFAAFTAVLAKRAAAREVAHA